MSKTQCAEQLTLFSVGKQEVTVDVQGGQIVSDAGLLPGDVLLSINGEPLRGLEALWEVLARLRRAEEIRVLVDRQGETVRLAYALTN